MKTIDGLTLKEMFISGSNNLYNHYPEVDALNVFPVPDGDTGMNMNLTLTSGSKEIQNRNDKNAGDIAKAFSRGLLMGARGNSGVITSQIFRGFAKGLEGLETVNSINLSNAFQKGVEVAYKAVMKPVEGTILTVIRESSQVLKDQVKDSYSIEKCFEILIKEAHESLNRTPELLPVLKEVGVVDSGGYGLIFIFEGMYRALKGNVIERKKATATDISEQKEKLDQNVYQVNFILNVAIKDKKPVVDSRLITHLKNRGLGEVELLHINNEQLQVKMKSLTPGLVINFVQQYGEFLAVDIHNIDQKEKIEFVNKEDLLKNRKKDKYAIIAVSAGEGISEFFKQLGVSEIVFGGQTMNPSTEDFVAAIKKCYAENIIILPNNSNIVLAASQACTVVDKDYNCQVIPSKTIPQGISACVMFDSELDLDDNLQQMNEALNNVKSGSVTFAIRDSEIDGVKVKKDDFIGILDKKIVCSHRHHINTVLDLLEQMVDENSAVITLLVGKDVDSSLVEKVRNKIVKTYPDVDIDIRDGEQPVYSFLIGVE